MFSRSTIPLIFGVSAAVTASVVPQVHPRAVATLNAQGYYDHLDPENFTVAAVKASP